MVYCFYDRWMTGLFLRWSWFSCELIVLYSIGCRMPKWIFCLMYMLVNPGDTRSGYIRRRLTFSGNGCPQASSILWDERSDLSVVCWVVTQVASFHFCTFLQGSSGPYNRCYWYMRVRPWPSFPEEHRWSFHCQMSEIIRRLWQATCTGRDGR